MTTKTAATKISNTTENIRMTFFMDVPNWLPTISGNDLPPMRSDIIAETKSCTPPAKIVPKTIHRKAAGPNITPMMAPKIGPRPAMFRN